MTLVENSHRPNSELSENIWSPSAEAAPATCIRVSPVPGTSASIDPEMSTMVRTRESILSWFQERIRSSMELSDGEESSSRGSGRNPASSVRTEGSLSPSGPRKPSASRRSAADSERTAVRNISAARVIALSSLRTMYG